jgi:hypothetical protein
MTYKPLTAGDIRWIEATTERDMGAKELVKSTVRKLETENERKMEKISVSSDFYRRLRGKVQGTIDNG